MTAITEFPSPGTLLPHRKPMLLVDRILEFDEKSCSAELTVLEDNIFVKKGILDPSALVECMAQTVACRLGLKKSGPDGEPAIGYLVGVDQMEFRGNPVQVGERLRIFVEESGSSGDFSIYNCTVDRDGEWICRGVIKVFTNRSDNR